jgi:hypothetical protein
LESMKLTTARVSNVIVTIVKATTITVSSLHETSIEKLSAIFYNV